MRHVRYAGIRGVGTPAFFMPARRAGVCFKDFFGYTGFQFRLNLYHGLRLTGACAVRVGGGKDPDGIGARLSVSIQGIRSAEREGETRYNANLGLRRAVTLEE